MWQHSYVSKKHIASVFKTEWMIMAFLAGLQCEVGCRVPKIHNRCIGPWELLWAWNWISGFHISIGVYWADQQLTTSKERLCIMKPTTFIIRSILFSKFTTLTVRLHMPLNYSGFLPKLRYRNYPILYMRSEEQNSETGEEILRIIHNSFVISYYIRPIPYHLSTENIFWNNGSYKNKKHIKSYVQTHFKGLKTFQRNING
jgi:hypothetical protein